MESPDTEVARKRRRQQLSETELTVFASLLAAIVVSIIILMAACQAPLR